MKSGWMSEVYSAMHQTLLYLAFLAASILCFFFSSSRDVSHLRIVVLKNRKGVRNDIKDTIEREYTASLVAFFLGADFFLGSALGFSFFSATFFAGAFFFGFSSSSSSSEPAGTSSSSFVKSSPDSSLSGYESVR